MVTLEVTQKTLRASIEDVVMEVRTTKGKGLLSLVQL